MPRECAQVVWHDLECGAYAVDLPLWLELASRAGGRVVEVGAGTGRVTLALAAEGHVVTALERERDLLDALRLRAAGMDVTCVQADARAFELEVGSHALCIVPMQTVQLLGGGEGRAQFLRRAHALLHPGGMLACALLGDVEPFECAPGERGPAPETALAGGMLYESTPTRVAVRRRSVVIERERRILGPNGSPDARASGALRVAHRERSVIELDRVAARMLRGEAAAAGFRAEANREVPPTENHIGSTVVMLRA